MRHGMCVTYGVSSGGAILAQGRVAHALQPHVFAPTILAQVGRKHVSRAERSMLREPGRPSSARTAECLHLRTAMDEAVLRRILQEDI